MKNLRSIILLLLLFPISAKCQFDLKGKIINPNNDIIAEVSVILNTADMKEKATRTNRSGTFIFSNIPYGYYTLKCSSIGYTDTLVKIELSQDTLIQLHMRPKVLQLDEVKIIPRKQLLEKQMDRIVFNAENSIAGTGGDALELIGKIPGIRVDNNTISIIGKGSVGVMINDRLIHLSTDDLSNYLKSIASDNIAKVEIIANPPAKYDAQGNNGLINIILKKPSKEGLQGSLNKNYSIATHSTFAGGGNLNYRKKKLTLYTNFNVRDGSISSQERTNVMYPNQTWDILNNFRNYRKSLNGQVNIEYQISNKVLIGGLYNTSHTNLHSDEKIASSIYSTIRNPDSILVSQANAEIKSRFSSTNLFFKKLIDTSGTQLLINADWFTNKNDKQRNFDNNTYINGDQLQNGSFAQYRSESKQNVDVYTLKADVDIPYKLYKISFGSKLTFIRNTSDISFYKEVDNEYLIDQNQTNDFNYTENTQALYINLNRVYKKWSIQTGLRGEYTQIGSNSIIHDQNKINSYIQLFPTAFVGYRLNERHGLSFSYGKRINRPPYQNLNPFRWYSNQYVYTEGNPFLKPSYNHNFEIAHSYRNIISTLSYSYTDNGYSYLNFTDTLSSLQVSKPLNFLSNHNYKLGNIISFTKISWLQSNNELDVMYNRSKSAIQGTAPLLKGLSAYLSTSNEFYFSKDRNLSAEVSFWYQFKNIDGVQLKRDQYNLNVGAKIQLYKKNIQLTFNVVDLLKSNRYRYTTLVNKIKQSYTNYYDSRQLRISIRYNFGNKNLKKQNRQIGSTEEAMRN